MQLNATNRLGQSMMILAVCIPLAITWVFLPHPAVAIALGLCPLLILFVLKQPFLMVLLFVLFSFFRLHEVFPQLYLLRIPLLLSIASLGALLWHLWVTRDLRIYWTPELIRAAQFFVVVILSIILASNKPLALNYFTSIYWKIIVMTFAIAWLSRTARDFSLSLHLITFSGLLVGLVALYNKVNSISLVEGTRVTIGRDLGSVLGDPNDLSLVLLFPFSFALALILSPNLSRQQRLFGIVTAIVLILAIIATQSRGGLLGIAAVIAAFSWRRVESKTLLISCGSLLLAALYLFAGISGRESGGAAEAGIDESAMGRLHAWEAAFGMAVDNPISGVGIDNFYHNYFFYSSYWDGLNHAVHSTWFGVLGETGFLGLYIFLAMVISVIRCAKKTLHKVQENADKFPPIMSAIAEGNLSGLIGFCVAGTFLTQGFTWPLYVLLAFTVAVDHFVSTHKTR
jgi:probable O-glycosylation ligase (exosortase A-associated)